MGKPEQLLSKYTTLGVGGPVEEVVEASERGELANLALQASLSGRPLAWIGSGSNILVHDRGFSGLIIHLGEKFSRIEISASIPGFKLPIRFSSPRARAGFRVDISTT